MTDEPKYGPSPLERVKQANPSPLEEFRAAVARFEAEQAERDSWTVQVRENPDGSWSAAA